MEEMYTVFYLDEVREDIIKAKQWYAEQEDFPVTL
jgi:hypothetical protein